MAIDVKVPTPINMAVGVSNVKIEGMAEDVVKDVGNFISGKILSGRKSVAKLSKNNIFKFDSFMDASINTDDQYPILKNIEKNYATMMMMAILNEGVIDRAKYSNIHQFLKTFHTNSNITVESCTIAPECVLSKDDSIAIECSIEELVDTAPINSMYQPFKRTLAKIERSLEIANEADNDADTLYFKVPRHTKTKGGEQILQTDKSGEPLYDMIKAPTDPKKYANQAKSYGHDAKSISDWNADPEAEAEALANSDAAAKKEADDKEAARKKQMYGERKNIKASLLQEGKNAAMTPTILQLSLNNLQDGATWTQDLMIGIKANPKLLTSQAMIDSVGGALKSSSFKGLFFTMINEAQKMKDIPWYDFVLGITASKRKVLAANNMQYINQLADVKKKSKATKAIPNANIIISSATAMEIKLKTGIDPYDRKAAAKLVSNYFLVAFGIYDETLNLLHMIYDGDSDFTVYPMRQMIAESKKDIIYNATKGG